MSNDSAFVIEDGVLIKYEGKDEEAIIPEGVTSIGKSAFRNLRKPKRDLAKALKAIVEVN